MRATLVFLLFIVSTTYVAPSAHATVLDCTILSDAVFGVPAVCVPEGSCTTRYFEDLLLSVNFTDSYTCDSSGSASECCIVDTIPACNTTSVYPDNQCYASGKCPPGTVVVDDLVCDGSDEQCCEGTPEPCVPVPWSAWSPCSTETNTRTRTRIVCVDDIAEEEEEEEDCSEPGEGCAQSWGFWKQARHRAEATCDAINLCGIDDDDLLLRTRPAKGNAWVINAHQYAAAQYARTCGCAVPNVTDAAMIDECGELLEESCTGTDGEVPYVGGGAGPLRREHIECAERLDAFLHGEGSVDHCSCAAEEGGSTSSGKDASDIDPEVIYEGRVLDALKGTIDYEETPMDFAYTDDAMSGVPSNTLKPWVQWVAGISGTIGGLLVVGVCVMLARKAIIHWRNRPNYNQVANDGSRARSDIMHDVPDAEVEMSPDASGKETVLV